MEIVCYTIVVITEDLFFTLLKLFGCINMRAQWHSQLDNHGSIFIYSCLQMNETIKTVDSKINDHELC